MKNNIIKLGYFFIFIFMALTVYLGYISFIQGPTLTTDPHNRRLAAAEAGVRRGTIYDRNGVELARDVEAEGIKNRQYPRGKDTAQLIGFVSQKYGRTGLESLYDSYLLGLDDSGKVDKVINRLLNRPSYGYDVFLTLDAELQRKAVNILGARRGAVVALHPQTGAVLVLASTPGFDPNKIELVVDRRTEKSEVNGKPVTQKIDVTYFDTIKNDEGSPLVNRATAGAYPPGSVFKVITAAGILSSAPTAATDVYDCRGSITVDGFVLKDNRVHGQVGFNEALAVSCNTTFARYGLQLGESGLRKAARSFGFVTTGVGKASDPETDGTTNNAGRFSADRVKYVQFRPGTLPGESFSKPEIASTAIGQGRALVSPMQMALVAAGIANRGVVMTPYILNEVKSRDGTLKESSSPKQLLTAMTPEVAGELAEAMTAVVRRGTGTAAAIAGITVAGKTGSAQNPRGDAHAWFAGFAPVENPRIVVAVVLENAGAGGREAAPVARAIMEDYLKGL